METVKLWVLVNLSVKWIILEYLPMGSCEGQEECISEALESS